MEQEYSKNMIYGNYLSMENQAFPIDCETLSALQNNIQKIAAIAKIAGCNLILSGCKISGTRRTEGYVYVDNGLTGEILYHPDQQKSDNCYIAEQNETVTADGTEYSDAYTTRYLAEGVGNAPIKWTSFTDISTISNSAINAALKAYKQTNDTALQNEITTREKAITAEKEARENADTGLQNQINALKTNTNLAFVKGMIMMWSGATNQIPSGWALCNGSNGTPDLRNRFIIGAGLSYAVGATGGATKQSVTLTKNNLPSHNHTITIDSVSSHSHTFKDYYYPENKINNTNSVRFYNLNQQYGSGDTDTDNQYILYTTHSTDDSGSHNHTASIGNTGNGSPFTVNTMPPFYALCFIMKL